MSQVVLKAQKRWATATAKTMTLGILLEGSSATLRVGQEVELDHPKYKGQKFIIKKINRTKCVINDGGHTMFTAPMSMIIA